MILCSGQSILGWIFWHKEEERRKRFQYCLNPFSLNKCLYFRAIQGHSGENFVNPLLKDNFLLLDDSAEYIYHIGNAFEVHSIIQSGLSPGDRSNRKNRQSVFFTAVNPIDTQPDEREVEYDVDKPRIAPYRHTWRSHHNSVFWCNSKLAQSKGLRFYQTRSHAVTLSDTRPAICIDKVVCMRTREEFCCKIYGSPRLPRVTLVPNFQHVRKDVYLPELGKSDDREGKPVAVNIVLIFESLTFHIPLLNKLKQIEKKMFDNQLSTSKITQTGICC